MTSGIFRPPKRTKTTRATMAQWIGLNSPIKYLPFEPAKLVRPTKLTGAPNSIFKV